MAKATVKRGTYLLELYNGDKYVFGNNYKWWYDHAVEYGIRKHRDNYNTEMFKSVQYSETAFVDDGGLKWCAADVYQEVIDGLAAEESKTLTPFIDYVFVDQPAELAKLKKELKRF